MPTIQLPDVPSQVLAVEVRGMRREMREHFQEDASFQSSMWNRVGSLTNLRWYAAGVIGVIGGVAILIWQAGPYFMKLAMQDAVTPKLEQQQKAQTEFIGAKLDQFKQSVDRSIADQAARIETLEQKQRRRDR